MEFNVKIQKTDVKIYEVNVSINYEELVEYVKNSHMSYSEYLDECCFDEDTGETDQIGRAHVWTPVTVNNLVCRLLLEKKKIKQKKKKKTKNNMNIDSKIYHDSA